MKITLRKTYSINGKSEVVEMEMDLSDETAINLSAIWRMAKGAITEDVMLSGMRKTSLDLP